MASSNFGKALFARLGRLGSRTRLLSAMNMEVRLNQVDLRNIEIHVSREHSASYRLSYLCAASPTRSGIGTDLAPILHHRDLATFDGACGRAAEEIASCLPEFPATQYFLVCDSPRVIRVFDSSRLTWKDIEPSLWKCPSCDGKRVLTDRWVMDTMISGSIPYCDRCRVSMKKSF